MRALGVFLVLALSLGLSAAEPPARGGPDSSAWPGFQGGLERQGYRPDTLSAPVSAVWNFETGNSVYSSPAVSQGVVYVGSSDGYFYALDARQGTQLWKTKLKGAIYGSSPSLVASLVLIGAHGGCLFALERETGRQVWKYCPEGKGWFSKTVHVLASPLAWEDRVYFGANDGKIRCLTIDAGKLVWEYQTGESIHDNGLALSGETLYGGSRDGHVYALDAVSGSLKWKSRHLDDLNTTPTLWGNYLYIGAGNKSLNQFSLADGRAGWTFSIPHKIISSPAISAEGVLVFGGGDGKVYAVNSRDGKKIWDFQTDDYVFSSPVITGRVAWIGGFDGYAYALDMRDGRKLWSHKTENGIYASPAVWEDFIYFGSRDSRVYAFRATRP